MSPVESMSLEEQRRYAAIVLAKAMELSAAGKHMGAAAAYAEWLETRRRIVREQLLRSATYMAGVYGCRHAR